jgi:hypothetical protein
MEELVDVIEPEYQLAICELYHPYFHGNIVDETDTVKNYIYNSYLCAYTIENDEMYDDDLYPTDNSGPWGLRQERIWPEIEHPTIRNYRNIVRQYQLDIVQPIYLSTGHMMCIPKTFWLKIIQRKYKKYYKELQKRIQRAKNPKVLLRRQITGCKL